MNKVLLKEEQISTLKELQARYVRLIQRCGELTFQKKIINSELESVDTAMEKLNLDRESVMNALEEQYGNGSVNLETGEFTSE